MINENILKLRKFHKLSQEEVADRIGVSRQTIAKWENGESIPDILHCNQMAEIFDITLDELVNYQSEEMSDIPMPPKGKYVFGTVTVGERGQIVIPAKARKIFGIRPGDSLLVLGDINQGIALTSTQFFMEAFEAMQKGKEEERKW